MVKIFITVVALLFGHLVMAEDALVASNGHDRVVLLDKPCELVEVKALLLAVQKRAQPATTDQAAIYQHQNGNNTKGCWYFTGYAIVTVWTDGDFEIHEPEIFNMGPAERPSGAI